MYRDFYLEIVDEAPQEKRDVAQLVIQVLDRINKKKSPNGLFSL